MSWRDAIELIGGPERRPIVIAEYDERWPHVFRMHARVIGHALGDRARLVAHVGSTSVPRLAAKPIIDIIVAIDDVEDEALFVPPLEDVGYALRVREPGHRMLRTPAHDVHVHMWQVGSHDIRRHLLFRDWLRVDDADRVRYEADKRRLAGEAWSDMNDYAEAKGPLIAEITARAEAWAAAAGWTPRE